MKLNDPSDNDSIPLPRPVLPLQYEREIDARAHVIRMRYAMVWVSISLLIWGTAIGVVWPLFYYHPAFASVRQILIVSNVLNQISGWMMFIGCCLAIPRKRGRVLPVAVRALMTICLVFWLIEAARLALPTAVGLSLPPFWQVVAFPATLVLPLAWAICVLGLLIFFCCRLEEWRLRWWPLWATVAVLGPCYICTAAIRMYDGFNLIMRMDGSIVLPRVADVTFFAEGAFAVVTAAALLICWWQARAMKRSA